MSEGVRPALDPVEWKQALSWEAGVADYVVGSAEAIGYGSDEPHDMLRVAALCLQVAGPDRKPLFTRADVEVIRHALMGWDGMGDVGDGTIDWVSPKYPNADTLADRLAALLPPEEPE